MVVDKLQSHYQRANDDRQECLLDESEAWLTWSLRWRDTYMYKGSSSFAVFVLLFCSIYRMHCFPIFSLHNVNL